MDSARAALDAVLQAGVDRRAVAGVVAVVVDRAGERYLGAAGERELGSGVAMTVDTVGNIHSMTKVFASITAMQQVERGTLTLDGDAGAVLDDLADPQVLIGFDPDGRPVTRTAAAPITLRRLLTHTSGFVYDFFNPELTRWEQATGTPDALSRTMASMRVPLMFDPGTRWEYGIGIDWAGFLVEAVTGTDLGDYMQTELLDPLGLADTAYVPTPSMLARKASYHVRNPDGSMTPTVMAPPADPELTATGGGGLNSTMPDFGRLMRMILNDGELGGRRLLQAETVRQMCRNNMGDLRVSELPTQRPDLSNDAEMFPGEAKSWGLGFQVHEQPSANGGPAGMLTWAGLANIYFWIDRTHGIAGAYLTQLLPFADKPSLGLFMDFQRAVYRHL